MSEKAWMAAYTKGTKSLQARLAKIHANNPEFQEFVKKHGFGGTLSKKQSEIQKKSSVATVKPVTHDKPEQKNPEGREELIRRAAEKVKLRRQAAANRVAFGGELGGSFTMPGMGFRTYREEKDPCWKGYTQYGMKKKNGKKVPNCVKESVPYKDAGLVMAKGGWAVIRKGKQVGPIVSTQDMAKRIVDHSIQTFPMRLADVLKKRTKEIAGGLGRFSYAAESAANRRRVRSWDSAIMPELKPLTVKPKKNDLPFDPDPPKKNIGVVKGKNPVEYSRVRHLARLGMKKVMTTEETNMFDNIRPGHTVHYLTPQGQTRKGKVVMNRGTHLVLNAGGRHGQPAVVTPKNYIKHSEGGKVKGALLSNVAKSLKKEEAEINEVSTEKLKRYFPKAYADIRKARIRKRNAWLVHDPDRLGGYDGEMAQAAYDDAEKLHKKRAAGAKRAAKILVSRGVKSVYEDSKDAEGASARVNKRKHKKLQEVSAPGQEDWIKANKQRFIDRYGKEKGTKILYAKAWKMAKEETANTEINEMLKHRPGAISSRRAAAKAQQEMDAKAKEKAIKKNPDAYNKHQERVKISKQLFKAVEKLHRDMLYAEPGKGKPIDNRTHNHLMRKLAALKEARESEYNAARGLAAGAGIDLDKLGDSKKEPGHYLMRGGRHVSGPHKSSTEATRAWKDLPNNHGVKIVHIKENSVVDVTDTLIVEAEKVKKAAEKAIKLAAAKKKGMVNTKPELHVAGGNASQPAIMGDNEQGTDNAKV